MRANRQDKQQGAVLTPLLHQQSSSKGGGLSHERQVHRLLVALAKEGAEAVRDKDGISVTHVSKGIRISGGRHTFVSLAALLESGAVLCLRRNGKTCFQIGEAGIARLARMQAEPEDAYLAQHRDIETITREEGGKQETLRINRREDPLDLLRRYRDKSGAPLCGPMAFAAADRFRIDLEQAQAIPQTTTNWSRMVVDGGTSRQGLAMSERVIAARTRLEAACHAVGADFANILFDICGFSKGLEALEKDHGWPVRSGKVIVSLALKALARHYGMDEAAHGASTTKMQFWASADYRPHIMGVT